MLRNAALLELFILCYTNTRSRLHTNWLYPASRNTYIYCNKKKHKALIIKQVSLATQRNAALLEFFILCYTNTWSRLHTN